MPPLLLLLLLQKAVEQRVKVPTTEAVTSVTCFWRILKAMLSTRLGILLSQVCCRFSFVAFSQSPGFLLRQALLILWEKRGRR